MTDETFPMYDNDVANALSHSGNEFTLTPEREIMSQLQTGREECFQLGRGDCSPTTEDRKENSEDKTYFHPVRLPCQYENGDAHLPMESRLSSPWQQEAVSPISVKNTERRPTKRIWTTLSPTVKPRGYQRSRMRAFNREFGYTTCKHPISCRQSDIRRWIPDDNRKDCRTFQVPPGSSNDYSRGEKPESYALHLERQLSLVAQYPEQQSCHLMLDTSLGDSQKDVACNRAAIDNTGDRHQERHLPLAADGQRELPNDACPPLFGHDDRYHYVQTELPSAQLETDKRACRYSTDRHDIGMQSHVIVPSTRPTMFPPETSDAHEKCRVSQHEYCPANSNLANVRQEEHSIRRAESIHLPPGVVRQRQTATTEPDLEQYIGLNESADLFLKESQWSTPVTRSDNQSPTVSCTASSVRPISRGLNTGTTPSANSASSLLLLPLPDETGSPEGIRSNREMASPPCMANGNLNRGPAAVWTGDNSVEETTATKRIQDEHVEEKYGHIYTGNGKSNNKTSKGNSTKAKTMSHIANNLSASAANRKTSADRKKGNEIFATASPSLATRIKCSKNEDNNTHFRLRTTERKEKKPLSRKR